MLLLESKDPNREDDVLTTVTTAVGVLPLAFTNELWQGLAWTIIFGIIFATVLSLIMVPIFYMMLEGKKK